MPKITIARFIFFYLFFYFIVINLIVINRFWQFENFYFDHGIYDGSLWKVSRLRLPFFDHIDNPRLLQLADHFSPSFYLLSLVYFFTSAYEPILVLQNLLFVSSAYILFLTCKKRLKNPLMLFALIFSYTLFIGIQNALISGLHPEFPAIFFLSLVFYFMDRKKWNLYWLSLIITLGFKETLTSVGLTLGIYLILKKELKQGIASFLFSLAYGIAVVKIIIPLISYGGFIYGFNVTNFPEMAAQLFYPWIKLKTILISFLSYGCLPVFGVSFLPVIFQDYFGRFVLNSGHLRWDLGMHYNAILNPLLFYGSLVGLEFLQKKIFYKKIVNLHAGAIIIIILYIHLFWLHGPMQMVFNFDFYKNTQKSNFLRNLLANVPEGKTVMTISLPN